MITEINNLQEFENLIQNSKEIYILDFYADWCGPCKMMMPIFESVSKIPEFAKLENLKFTKINRDQNRDLIAKYGFNIPTIPRFFIVKFNGKNFTAENILMEMGGSQSKTDMKNKILEIGKNQGLFPANFEFSNSKKEQKTNHSEKKKVAIIGSGPSGLTAGIYTSRAQLDTTIYLGMQPGGQLTTTTEIENFPGAWNQKTKQGMMGPDLMQLIQKQAEHFGAKTKLENVDSLEVYDKKFKLKIGNKVDIYDAVIIATGASARYLGLKGEEKYIGKGYHSCATCDGFFYRGKEVAIVGGGDSAMEEANFLTRFAKKVYIINRSENFRASKIMFQRVKNNPKIEILLNKVVDQFLGKEEVEGLILKDTINEEKSELNVDGLFVAIGHIPNSGFVGNLLDKDKAGYLIPQSKVSPEFRISKYDTATKIPGVFVAGDIEDTTYRQAITAAGDGCKAAIDVERWLENND
jgi:thioredoxin reductase (NADPH)